jgi:hypothetical protein
MSWQDIRKAGGQRGGKRGREKRENLKGLWEKGKIGRMERRLSVRKWR